MIVQILAPTPLLAAGTRLDNNYSHKVKLQHLFVCSNLV